MLRHCCYLLQAIFHATCLVFDDHKRLKGHFHWLVMQTIAAQVAGQMLHFYNACKILLSATVSVTCLARFLTVARYATVGNVEFCTGKIAHTAVM